MSTLRHIAGAPVSRIGNLARRYSRCSTPCAQEGLSYSEIARRTGYERRSIAKWLTFKAPPDRRRAALNPTSPWYFETFLAQCWKDGNRCGRHLFHDVKQRGYTGSFSNLERLLGAWRRAEREQVDDVPPTTLKLGAGSRSGYRSCDLASGCRGAVHQATRPADDSAGKKGRCPEAGI